MAIPSYTITSVNHALLCFMSCTSEQLRNSQIIMHARPELAPVALASEVEVEVQDAALEGALEALLVAVLPLLVQDLERNVLVGRPRVEAQQACAAVLVRLRVLRMRACISFSPARCVLLCQRTSALHVKYLSRKLHAPSTTAHWSNNESFWAL